MNGLEHKRRITMRDILFRGKRLTNGEWVYGSLILCNGEASIWSEELKDDVGVISETVGQYTDITDSKGKRICEGDIVSVYSNIDKKECLGHIEFLERGFWAFVPANSEDFFCHDDGVPNTYNPSLDLYYLVCNSKEYDNAKVIGNIHDNPELIGDTNDEH